MKKLAIIALVCVNVALLALVLGRALPEARAQTVRGASNYLLTTGQIENDYDVVYVMDLSKRQLKAWQFDRTKKKLQILRGRDLVKDFKGRR